MAEGGERVVGFECEFVEEPPKWLQTECPVCLLILRDPYQVTCCGKSFCRECIERVKAGHKPCPCCKQDTFNDFPNKGLRQPLYGFKVHYSYKVEGCEWRGELGQLDNHLNLNSTSEDHQLQGCPLANVKCSFCTEAIKRKCLLIHKNEFCDKRPFTCQHCRQYESTYDDVITNHWPVCDCHPVTCPNECGAEPQRKDLDSHVKQVCPATVIECDFSYAGCEVRLPRSKMAAHFKADLVNHFSLLALSHKKQQEDLKQQKEILKKQQEDLKQKTEEIEYLKKQMSHKDEDTRRALHAEIERLKRQTMILSSQIAMFPVDFQIPNPKGSDTWVSSPFYTHDGGYKLSFTFYKLGSSYCLSVCLLQGEYDDLLGWPVTAEVNVHILDHGNALPHKRIKINITNKERVRNKIYRSKGSSEIVSDSVDGIKQLAHDDTLYVRVVGVQLYNV